MKPDWIPENTTGPEENDCFYRSDITGPDGAHFELLREEHHTSADIKAARNYLKQNFDVVSITMIFYKNVNVLKPASIN
jgi:hypothetical protein